MASRWKKRPVTNRGKRARALVTEVGNEPGKDSAIGECLGALFSEVKAIRDDEPVTNEFRAIRLRIQNIKTRYPEDES